MSGQPGAGASRLGSLNCRWNNSNTTLLYAAAIGVLAMVPAAAAFARSSRVFRRYFRRIATIANPSQPSPPVLRKERCLLTFGDAPLGNAKDAIRCSPGETLMSPPVVREDPYWWIRDDTRKNKEVLAHLEEENEYCKSILAPLQPLKKQLFREYLSHMKETDARVPYRKGDWYYYSRSEEGKSYAIYCRKYARTASGDIEELRTGRAEDLSAAEQIILDVNKLAEGRSFCDVQDVEPSEDHELLAYTVDFSGYETYDIHFKILPKPNEKTGVVNSPQDIELDDVIRDVADLTWGHDSSTIYYWTHDAEHRPDKLWRHKVSTKPRGKDRKEDVAPSEKVGNEKVDRGEDEMLYEEKDKKFSCGSYTSSDSQYLLVESSSSMTTELRFIKIGEANGFQAHKSQPLQLFSPRTHDLRYDVDHWRDQWFIVTNKNKCINQRIMTCSDEGSEGVSSRSDSTPSTHHSRWKDLIPYDPQKYLKGIKAFKDFIVVSGREGGFSQLWTFNPNKEGAALERIEFPDDVHTVHLSTNCFFDTSLLRIGYATFTIPSQVIDFNVVTKEKILLKEQPAPNYDRSDYSSIAFKVPSLLDGRTVTVSCVYNNKIYPKLVDAVVEGNEAAPKSSSVSLLPQTQNIPFFLYGYGSYGISMDPRFDFRRLSMLDRGVVYAMAHIRGGADLGRAWYEEEGKYLTKKNTFYDFISCADWLAKSRMTSTNKICICGRSAGGLLVGASVNLRPDLFKAAIADVPFVDVLNTMRDSTIPLTTGEWEEWGNPNLAKYYYYMLEYSPYDNVRATAYPSMFVSAGLYDSRVAYWEPTKWVAKLRETKTDDRPVILKMEMDCGHFSASDRYKNMREMAEESAWVLDQLGATELLVPAPPLPSEEDIKSKFYKS